MVEFLVFAFDIFAEIMFYLIFIRVIMSWFGVKNQLQLFLSEMTDPVILPFSKIAKTKMGLDFSPILAMISIQLIQYFIHAITGVPYLKIFF